MCVLRNTVPGICTNVTYLVGNGVKVRKFAPHVRILKEDEHTLSWVTSYEVVSL